MASNHITVLEKKKKDSRENIIYKITSHLNIFSQISVSSFSKTEYFMTEETRTLKQLARISSQLIHLLLAAIQGDTSKTRFLPRQRRISTGCLKIHPSAAFFFFPQEKKTNGIYNKSKSRII